MSESIAHIIQSSGKPQTVLEHLTGTARLAASFAEPFGAADCAYRCGMLHDVGKYSARFQKRIHGANLQVDHSTAGAQEAFALRDPAAAFSIAGHHGGIPDRGSRCDPREGTLLTRMAKRPGCEIEDYSAYRQEVTVSPAVPPSQLMTSPESAFFYTHMLFSCLVDADWLDTEAFMQDGQVQRETGEPLDALAQKLDAYVSPWWSSDRPLNIRRCQILRQLMDSGATEKGLYTLTVPTGGGKTVSSMAFALRHALHNTQRRMIYIIPFNSILEQTQRVFEDIFGVENVVAHYANVTYATDENGELSDADRRRYLATENWDAPIILTTAVQFFESLFGNRPACCRKLHNIANSVLIFDEAQMLPANHLYPCVFSITELVKRYGCTAVLCTATQPSLEPIIRKFLPEGARELCPNPAEQSAFFRRVNYRYEGYLADGLLSQRLAAESQVLCVVNSRKQAQTLYAALPPAGSYHLSTTMTPVHRRRTLDEIRARLRDKQTCRVVSTSLIEAGVDVDFPCVYRAVAGLDSIIQAGGRCNRENKRSAQASTVHVFDPEEKPPASLTLNIAAAKTVLERFPDIASPDAIDAYFHRLLYLLKDDAALDQNKIFDLMRMDMAFSTVAKVFHLIENNTITVYVPLDGGKPLVDELLSSGPSRALMRRLGQYAVSVYDNAYQQLDAAGAVQRLSEDTAVLLNTACYDKNTGLTLSPQSGQALFDVEV